MSRWGVPVSDVVCPLPRPVDPGAAKAKLREVQQRRKSLSPAAQERMAAREFGTDVPTFRAALKTTAKKPVASKAKTPGIKPYLSHLPRISKPTHKEALKGANKGINLGMSKKALQDIDNNMDQMLRRTNCSESAAAYEMRRRGFNVVARPSAAGKYTGEIADVWGVNSRNITPWKNLADLEQHVSADPVGARYILNLHFKNGDGHVINAEKMKDGSLRFIDAQLQDDNALAYLPDLRDGHAIRVDDKEPGESVLKDFMEGKR